MATYNDFKKEANGNVAETSSNYTSKNTRPKLLHQLPKAEAIKWQMYLDGNSSYPTLSCVLGPIN